MHYSLMELVIRHGVFTFAIGYFDNGAIVSSLFGFTILRIKEDWSEETHYHIHFDAFYGYFLAYVLMGMYKRLRGR